MTQQGETRQLYDMAGAMLKLGNQHDDDGLARFVEDYPDLAEPAHLRDRAWALSVQWLSELPTGGEDDAARSQTPHL